MAAGGGDEREASGQKNFGLPESRHRRRLGPSNAAAILARLLAPDPEGPFAGNRVLADSLQ